MRDASCIGPAQNTAAAAASRVLHKTYPVHTTKYDSARCAVGKKCQGHYLSERLESAQECQLLQFNKNKKNILMASLADKSVAHLFS